MGLINYTNIQDNTTADAADINSPLNIIYSEFNGNIDSNNIKDNSIIASKINNGAVTAAKIADNNVTPAKLASGITLTNAATMTLDATSRINIVAALNTNVTFNTPTNASYDGQSLLVRIKDNGTARTIAWSAGFRAVGVTLPTTTVISKMLYVGVIYNQTDGVFDVISVARQA